MMKVGIWINSDMLNSMVTFTFPVLDQKYAFGANVDQKIRIV